MFNAICPNISVERNERARLEQLALEAHEDFHPVAGFLLSELRRAHIVDDRLSSETVIGLDRWATFSTDLEQNQTRILVRPGEYFSSRHQLSVLSPIGAALLGLRTGDRMPFVSLEWIHNIVTVVGIGTISVVAPFARSAKHELEKF
jgi:regulator of nucleoside diphosphate kinase